MRAKKGGRQEGDEHADVVARVAAGQAGETAEAVERPVDGGQERQEKERPGFHGGSLCADGGASSENFVRDPLKARGAAS